MTASSGLKDGLKIKTSAFCHIFASEMSNLPGIDRVAPDLIGNPQAALYLTGQVKNLEGVDGSSAAAAEEDEEDVTTNLEALSRLMEDPVAVPDREVAIQWASQCIYACKFCPEFSPTSNKTRVQRHVKQHGEGTPGKVSKLKSYPNPQKN